MLRASRGLLKSRHLGRWLNPRHVDTTTAHSVVHGRQVPTTPFASSLRFLSSMPFSNDGNNDDDDGDDDDHRVLKGEAGVFDVKDDAEPSTLIDEDLLKATGQLRELMKPDLSTVWLLEAGKPLFPGFNTQFTVTDPNLIAQLKHIRRSSNPYVCMFVAREPTDREQRPTSIIPLTAAESADLDRLHDVGTLVEIQEISPRRLIDVSEVNDIESFGSRLKREHGVNIVVRPMNRVKILDVNDVGSGAPFSVALEEIEDEVPVQDAVAVGAKSKLLKDAVRELYSLNQTTFSNHLLGLYEKKDGPALGDLVAFTLEEDKDTLQTIFEERNVKKRMDLILAKTRAHIEKTKAENDMAMQELPEGFFPPGMIPQMGGRQFGQGGPGGNANNNNNKAKGFKARLAERLEAMEENARGLFGETENTYRDEQLAFIKEAKVTLPAHVKAVVDEEMSSAERGSGQAEAHTSEKYVDLLTSMPWGVYSEDHSDINTVREVLEREHYGMDDVNNGIIEFVSVAMMSGNTNGKILCLVGPPGTGKTSIGESIARALNRKFVRMSVGGMTDAHSLRGHRRTYVSAMPGRVVNSIKKAKTFNPLIMIDELDKVGSAYSRSEGDMENAMLELLDPSQNHSFSDEYLDLPLDVSRVFFVCTANDLSKLSKPLLDRMEIVEVEPYDPIEKAEIARRHLIPRAMEKCGLGPGPDAAEANSDGKGDEEKRAGEEEAERTGGVDDTTTDGAEPVSTEESTTMMTSHIVKPTPEQIKEKFGISEETLERLVQEYSFEGGVRSLNRHIEKILRKQVTKFLQSEDRDSESFITKASELEDILGQPIRSSDTKMFRMIPGMVFGIGVSGDVYGSLLPIEVTGLKTHGESGGNRIVHTGTLEESTQESFQVAYLNAQHFVEKYYPENDFFQKHKVHIHMPTASRKGGNSAGLAATTAIISLALDIPVPPTVSMTGEISLTGSALAIGGVRAKILGAKRSGVTTVFLPLENQRDVDKVKDVVKEGIDIRIVKSYDEIFQALFGDDRIKEMQVAAAE